MQDPDGSEPSLVSKLRSALERADRYQEILRDFGRFTTGPVTLNRLLDHTVRLLSRATGVAHTKVMRYRPDNGDLLVIAGVGWQEGVVGNCRIGIDMASPAGRALQTGQPVLLADNRSAPGFRYSPVLNEHGIAAVLNAPVPVNGAIWGVVELDSETPDAFNQRDQLFLESFAVQLGTAIRHICDKEALVAETEAAARRLAQRDLLAREEHHRVKNYFQTILAALNLKASAGTPALTAAIQDVMDRVMAIALAHDLLIPRDGPALLNTADYIRALSSAVETASANLRIEVKAAPVDLRSEQAVPLGLILNELLTNAVKYALPDQRPDEAAPPASIVRVDFSSTFAGEALLRVLDNGPGMTAPPRPGSAGLSLVRGLAAQLGGTLEVDSSSQGTAVSVRFPLIC